MRLVTCDIHDSENGNKEKKHNTNTFDPEQMREGGLRVFDHTGSQGFEHPFSLSEDGFSSPRPFPWPL